MVFPKINISINIMEKSSCPQDPQIGILLLADSLTKPVNAEDMGKAMNRVIRRIIFPDFI
jgi:hypothetical protein